MGWRLSCTSALAGQIFTADGDENTLDLPSSEKSQRGFDATGATKLPL